MAFFEDLEVWQDARTLAKSIYELMSDNRDFGFRDQIQRAAVSIMNNIAEGSESGSNATNIRFLNIAKGMTSLKIKFSREMVLLRKRCFLMAMAALVRIKNIKQP